MRKGIPEPAEQGAGAGRGLRCPGSQNYSWSAEGPSGREDNKGRSLLNHSEPRRQSSDFGFSLYTEGHTLADSIHPADGYCLACILCVFLFHLKQLLQIWTFHILPRFPASL